jgi:hypothetical protein
MKRILTLLGVLLFSTPIFAQTPVVTQPYSATSYNASGTIAVTNTFQSVFAAPTTPTGRVACTIQNNGTHNMWVFFGPIAKATEATSVILAANQTVNCNSGNVILQDQVSITGTASDAFFAAQQ